MMHFCQTNNFPFGGLSKTNVLFCKSSLSKMASVRTNKNKNLTPLLKANFSRQKTLSLGPKRFLHSKGPKNVICLWLRLGNIKQNQICYVYIFSIFPDSANNKSHFQDLQSEGIFLDPKTKLLFMKSWSLEVVSIFCFCLF